MNTKILKYALVCLPAILLSTIPLSAHLSDSPKAELVDASKAGYLKVYSAMEERPNGEGTVTYIHSLYEIYRTDGTKLRQVLNREEKPERVKLPSGQYIVVADSENNGVVRLPVTIKSGQITRLYLDGRSDAR